MTYLEIGLRRSIKKVRKEWVKDYKTIRHWRKKAKSDVCLIPPKELEKMIVGTYLSLTRKGVYPDLILRSYKDAVESLDRMLSYFSK